MQKTGHIFYTETFRAASIACTVTSKVNPADIKVNPANAQSHRGGILFAPANSKLYFEALKMLSVPQNNLPRAGEGNAPKSHLHQKRSPLKSQKYGNRKKQTAAGRA
jgi:hypothetical protein